MYHSSWTLHPWGYSAGNFEVAKMVSQTRGVVGVVCRVQVLAVEAEAAVEEEGEEVVVCWTHLRREIYEHRSCGQV